jgi:hypothetical protein
MFDPKWTIKKLDNAIYLYVADKFYDEIYNKLSKTEWLSIERGANYIWIKLLEETYDIDDATALEYIKFIANSVYKKELYPEWQVDLGFAIDLQEDFLKIDVSNENVICLKYIESPHGKETEIYMTKDSAIAVADALRRVAK